MRKIRLFLTFLGLFVLGLAFPSQAQQEIQVSQYMFTTLFYNPAYAGVEGMTNFTALHRDQWTTYSVAPKTQLFMLDAPVLSVPGGVGLVVINDNLANQNNLRINLNVAYHVKIKNSKLSLGIKGGIFSQSIDAEQYNAINEDDPLLLFGRPTQVRPDLGLGAFLRHEDFYVGASIDHLLKSDFNFDSDSLRNAMEDNLTVTAGYDIRYSNNFTISPSFLVKSDFNQYSFDVAVLGYYDERMWGGLGFRQAESASVYLGYSFFKDKALKLGYTFDYVINGREAKKQTSNEILLKYTLPVASAGGKKIIRTPRFRH